MGVRNFLSRELLRREWRKRNKHNDTLLKEPFNIDAVTVGKCSYGALRVILDNDENRLIIGNYCSIAPEVIFIPGSEHAINTVSTYPFKVKCMQGQQHEALSKGDIIVEDDVWIGCRATIMSGVRIGQGAVVAAGAVVTKDVPPYAVVGGVPAKVIKYRFAPHIIEELLKVDYGKLTKKMIETHIDDLYKSLDNVEQIIWMPQK